jgi:hypothetical protein
MTSKIRIKLGTLEVDYEGPEEFLKQDLPSFLKNLAELQPILAPSPKSKAPGNGEGGDGSGSESNGSGGEETSDLSVESIAAKLGANSGPDLILAAAACLTFSKKQKNYSRKDLLTEMKLATGYYKSSYSKNLSAYLKTLLADSKLNQGADSKYALPAPARDEILPKLK